MELTQRSQALSASQLDSLIQPKPVTSTKMTILKNIPSCLTPEILFILASMGHGDELVIADANFPANSIAKHSTYGKSIRCDGINIPELLDAILTLFPLDNLETSGGTKFPVTVMDMMDSHKKNGWEYPPTIWKTYQDVLKKHQEDDGIERVERFSFYDQAKTSYAIISTGETALYANVILRKGIIKPKQ